MYAKHSTLWYIFDSPERVYSAEDIVELCSYPLRDATDAKLFNEAFAAASEHITLETPHKETHWRAVRVTNVGNYGDCGIFTGV